MIEVPKSAVTVDVGDSNRTFHMDGSYAVTPEITTTMSDSRSATCEASFSGGVSYSTSNSAVAAVDQNGNIKTITPGTAAITVSTGGTNYIINATVEDHKWSSGYVATDSVSCTEDGKEAYECSICGAKKGERIVKAPGHSYSGWKVTREATCESSGLKENVCSRCGDTQRQEIPATGHKWETKYRSDQKATCTSYGIKSIHCSVCDEIKEGSEKHISPKGHNYKIKSSDGTNATIVCKRCGDEYSGTKPDMDQLTPYWRNATLDPYSYYWNYIGSLTKGDVLEYWIAGGSDYDPLCDFVVTLSKPSMASIEKNSGTSGSITWLKGGNTTITLTSRYFPDDKFTIKVNVYDPDGSSKKKSKTSIGRGTSAKKAEKVITAMKSDTDPKGSVFRKLLLKSTKQTKTSITLKWTKNNKAVKYVIYGNKCGKTTKPKKIATVKGKNTKTLQKVAGKKLKKGTYYKFIIVALDKNNKVVSTSKLIHVATKGGKVGNVKSISVKKSVLTKAKKLKKGKTLKLNAKAVAQSKKLKVKKHVAIRYESSNKKIATVTKKGVVKAKKKGTCYVYVYAQNGVFKKIKIVVK